MNRSIETQKLINEKTIQRYIFEKLNYGNQETIKQFFPNDTIKLLREKKIKVIIPNYPVEYTVSKEGVTETLTHIADFRIIYNDNTYHNIEVEWVTSRFSSHKCPQELYNQCYKENKGFLIVLEDDSRYNANINYILSKDIKQISSEGFSYWFTFKSKYLVDETISNYVPNFVSRSRKTWLIYLPSSGANGGKSKTDYLNKGKAKGKWAFKYSNKGKHMQNILNIYGGDIVIFIWELKVLNNTHQRQISLENDWYFNGIEVTKVTKGYYCDFNDETFETDEWKVQKKSEEKQYMHYFNFDKNYIYSSCGCDKRYFYKDDVLNINDRAPMIKGIIEKLSWSHNNQGVPIELSTDEYNLLLIQIGLT